MLHQHQMPYYQEVSTATKKSRLESMLDMDFDDDDDERMDEIDRYLLEKSEAKGIDVLMW